MIETFVLVIGLILIGQLMKRSEKFPTNTTDVLNNFVLNVSLPAMILYRIPQLKISPELIYPVGMHWILYPLNIAFVLLFGKMFRFSKSVLGCLLIVCCVGNTAFLGIPVINGFFGNSAIAYAVLYDQLGSALAFIFGMAFMLPKFTGEGAKGLKSYFVTLIKFPPFVALLIGFICIKYPLNNYVNDLLRNVSMTLIPCAMITVGFQMKFRMSVHQVIPIVIGLGIKLVLIPVIALGIYGVLNKDVLSLKVSVIQSGMPPMVTAGALAMAANLEKEIAAALVGYGLIISFLSLPILKYFL